MTGTFGPALAKEPGRQLFPPEEHVSIGAMDRMSQVKPEETGGSEVEGPRVSQPTPHRLQGLLQPDLPASAGQSSLRTALADLLYYRWFVAQTVTIGALIAVLVTLILPNQYTSTAILLPSGKGGSLGSLTRGLSRQLADLGIGGTIPGADPSESSELFPDILRSHTVGEAVLAGFYTRTAQSGEEAFSLYDYFDSDYAFESLYDCARISQEPNTGIITIAVTTPFPEFSQQIAAAFLRELETFNRERRSTHGMEKAAFLSERLTEVKAELDTAENELKTFRSRNMNFAQSSDPEILAELSRFERNTRIKAEVFALLTQQHELARLEAADQMPIVQVLDSPSVPNKKSGPARRVIVAVTALLSFAGACVVTVGLRPARQAFPDSTLLDRLRHMASRQPLWNTMRLKRAAERSKRNSGG